MPRAVLDEVKNGAVKYPQLAEVEKCSWLSTVRVESLQELVAFAAYARRLGAGEHNIGESSVLAWAEVNGGVVLIDDQDAVQSAKEKHLQVCRSLTLIATGLSRKLLDELKAAELVDALAKRGGARFPCDGSGFVSYAQTSGLL